MIVMFFHDMRSRGWVIFGWVFIPTFYIYMVYFLILRIMSHLKILHLIHKKFPNVFNGHFIFVIILPK
jgi:hypothetical protein